MQEDGSTTARAIVRVVPDRAACYWKAVSEALDRAGAHGASLEINVLEPSTDPSEGMPRLVELEMRCAGLDQSTLDEAVLYASATCGGPSQSASSDSSSQSPTREATNTRWGPVGVRPNATIKEPLVPRSIATIHSPLFAKAMTAHEPSLGALQPPPAELTRPVADEPGPQAATHSKLRPRVLEVFNAVVVLVAIVIGLRLLIQTFSVDGPSMQPTFQTDQRLLINRAAYWHVDGTPFEGLVPTTRQGSIAYVFGGPRRGDVVVFRPPGESGFQADLIKRIIGLPGDTVSIQAGQVFVNGQPIVEPYVQFAADYTYPDRDLAVLIPNDSYFVLGDNRPVSLDSHLGWVVPADKLVGQAWLSYWPISQWRVVPAGGP